MRQTAIHESIPTPYGGNVTKAGASGPYIKRLPGAHSDRADRDAGPAQAAGVHARPPFLRIRLRQGSLKVA